MITQCQFCNITTYCPIKATDINKTNIEEYYLCEECGSQYLEFHTEINFTTTNSIPFGEKYSCYCGLTRQEFEKTGRFGCDKCYEFLKKEIREILFVYHNAKNHIGKFPKNINTKELLEFEYKKAIETENYEKAEIIKKRLEKFNSP